MSSHALIFCGVDISCVVLMIWQDGYIWAVRRILLSRESAHIFYFHQFREVNSRNTVVRLWSVCIVCRKFYDERSDQREFPKGGEHAFSKAKLSRSEVTFSRLYSSNMNNHVWFAWIQNLMYFRRVGTVELFKLSICTASLVLFNLLATVVAVGTDTADFSSMRWHTATYSNVEKGRDRGE